MNINFDYRQRYSVPQCDEREGGVYRLNNPYTGAHLFTPNADECRGLLLAGWVYEKREWTAPQTGTPVYRLYNSYSHDHFYTSSRSEYDGLGAAGWDQEGPCFYTIDGGPVAVYRLYNSYVTEGTHLFTTSVDEYNNLVSLGWTPEGPVFYGIDR